MKALNNVLKTEGFKKKNSNFYKETPDFIYIISVEKSPYGNTISFTMEVWLKVLGDYTNYPHVIMHPEYIVKDVKLYASLLKYDDDNNNIEVIQNKMKAVVNIVHDELLPYLFQYKNPDDIRNLILRKKAGDGSNYGVERTIGVRVDVWNYFGISWKKEVKLLIP